MVCWFRTYSESSFKPASVKYFVKCSTLCLLAGKSSWNENLIWLNGLQIIQKTHFPSSHRLKMGKLPVIFSLSVVKKVKNEKSQTISLLSMLTFRRLAATALISFSFIHDLKSFTAKAAETPVEKQSLFNRSTFLDSNDFVSPCPLSEGPAHRIIHFIPKPPSATVYRRIPIPLLYHLLCTVSQVRFSWCVKWEWRFLHLTGLF